MLRVDWLLFLFGRSTFFAVFLDHMKSLPIERLHPGYFPFTGRADETEHLVSFCRSVGHTEGLRALLLLGERGVGKSRLLDHVSALLSEDLSIILRLRVHPESAHSITRLLVDALKAHEHTRQLLRDPLDGSLNSILKSFRRLCRLRVTAIVIDDAQLLSGDAVGELATLLHSLQDEPLAVILSSTPTELRARVACEAFLVEQLKLSGLSLQEIGTITEDLFGGIVESRVLRTLSEVTLGNPLALRAAFRGPLSSGIFISEGGRFRWNADVAPKEFEIALERNVRTVVEGFIAGLDEAELAASASLATLGESFSIEAATTLVPQSAVILPRLRALGILCEGTEQHLPIGESAEDGGGPLAPFFNPLSFTHSLVHRYFLSLNAFDVPALLEIIGARAPIFSFLPLTFIADHLAESRIGSDLGLLAADELRELATGIDQGAQWRHAHEVCDLGLRLLQSVKSQVDAGTYNNRHQLFLQEKINLQRRRYASEEFRSAFDEYRVLSEEVESPGSPRLRLLAICDRALSAYSEGEDGFPLVIADLEALTEEHPELWNEPMLLWAITYLCRQIIPNDRLDQLHRLHRYFLRSLESVPDKTRRQMKHSLGFFFLLLLDSSSSVESRIREVDYYVTLSESHQFTSVRSFVAQLYDQLGMEDQSQRQVNLALPVFEERGWDFHIVRMQIIRLGHSLANGSPFGQASRELGLTLQASDSLTRDERSYFVRALRDVAILNEVTEEMNAFIEKYFNTEETRSRISVEDHLAALNNLIYTKRDYAQVLRAVGYFNGVNYRGEDLQPLIEAKIREAFEWLKFRHIQHYRQPLVRLLKQQYSGEEIKQRFKIGGKVHNSSTGIGGTQVFEISVLGTISIAGKNGPQRLQGSRAKKMLATLVAQELIAKPLALKDFCRVATDEGEDIERARNIIYVALHRLREELGEAFILSTSPSPQLNPSMVNVDILRSNAKIELALAALREGAYVRAVSEARAGLEIWNGGTPFPGLYDNFFETAREEFEFKLSTVVIKTAKALIAEEDFIQACSFLQFALTWLKDDLAIAALLNSARAGVATVT